MRPYLTASLIAAFGIAACGTASNGAYLRYRDQAEAVCSSLRHAGTTLAPPSGRSDLAQYVQQTLTLANDGERRLRELRPPPSLAAANAKLATAMIDRNAVVSDVLSAIAAGTPARRAIADAAPHLEALTDSILVQAGKLGVTDCG
jgi:hypothetical protein